MGGAGASHSWSSSVPFQRELKSTTTTFVILSANLPSKKCAAQRSPSAQVRGAVLCLPKPAMQHICPLRDHLETKRFCREGGPCAHLAQPYSTILVSPGFRLPFFGCQFPDKTETGNSNCFCKAVVVPTEPGDT